MEQAQMKQYEKNPESFELQKEQQRYEKAVGKDRSQSRDASELQRKMINREEEKPMKAWIQREEKERLMRKKYIDFLKEKGLYHQSSKHSSQDVNFPLKKHPFIKLGISPKQKKKYSIGTIRRK